MLIAGNDHTSNYTAEGYITHMFAAFVKSRMPINDEKFLAPFSGLAMFVYYIKQHTSQNSINI